MASEKQNSVYNHDNLQKSSLFLLIFFAFVVQQSLANQNFIIDYENDTFLKDGETFQYISGSIHYSRIPHQYWKDRLTKMYTGGLNVIQIYVPWNIHETSPGVYDFSGQQDLESFLGLAQTIGLFVLLRPGPYICAEWDFGGLPAWLVRQNGSVVMRTMDPGFINPVDKWMDILLPKMKPLMYENGGPILMVQVENEYGSYFACDHNYTSHLRDTFVRHLGEEATLFTTDWNIVDNLRCGAIDGVYATVDFGPTDDVHSAFSAMREFNGKGPLVNSEYYTGWLDHWGGTHSTHGTQSVVKTLKDMLDIGASVNMYMYEGGTNFAYTNGANDPFAPCPTSYDYDAPLSEPGDPTEKYHAIRNLTKKYKPLPPIPVPPPMERAAYGRVNMIFVVTVVDFLASTEGSHSLQPRSMEELSQDSGFMMYRHQLEQSCSGKVLSVPNVRDRAHVMVDGVRQGILDRLGKTSFNFIARQSSMLDILVENQGHINFGANINGNRKGLDFVEYDGKNLTAWTMYPLNLTKFYDIDLQSLRFRKSQASSKPNGSPAIFRGDFRLPENSGDPKDTYLRLDGWFKGQVLVNAFNLGRYWPVRGPQVTLYVPAPVLLPYPQSNTIIIMELDNAPCGTEQSNCSVTLTDKHVIDGPVDS